jgi:hypothetical protein
LSASQPASDHYTQVSSSSPLPALALPAASSDSNSSSPVSPPRTTRCGIDDGDDVFVSRLEQPQPTRFTRKIAFTFVLMKTSRTAYMHYSLMSNVMQQASWCDQNNPWTMVFAFVFGEPLHHSRYSYLTTSVIPSFLFSLQPPMSQFETSTLCVMQVVTARAILRVCLVRMAMDVGACILCSVVVALVVFLWENRAYLYTRLTTLSWTPKHTSWFRVSRQSSTGDPRLNPKHKQPYLKLKSG